MMGHKRMFAPLVGPSLEALLPPDHFYRQLECTLDLPYRIAPSTTSSWRPLPTGLMAWARGP
jgi:hypothetical protein